MLGSTDPLSIWGKFAMGYYSFQAPDGPVCLDIHGGPGPMGPTGEMLLGEIFSLITKITCYLLLMCSPLIGLHWRLGICVTRNYIFSLILEMLWSETGYFGLLGNKHSLYIILLYLIER